MKLEKITSRENRRLIHARKARDGRSPDLMFIEGRRLVTEALRSDVRTVECFINEDFKDEDLIGSIGDLGIDVLQLSATLFRSLAATDQSQGVILLAERPVNSFDMSEWRDVKVPIFLYLKEINNPSNLGAVLRSAEAAGAGGVFVSRNSADVFSPKALRASMGSAFRIPIRVDADLSAILGEARTFGIDCLAVDTAAGRAYLDVDWRRPHLLIYGSEAHGLSVDEMALIGEAVSIPMDKPVESLNLAVAAAIVLFEARRVNQTRQVTDSS